MQKRNKLPFNVPIKTGQVKDGKGGQATKWPALMQTKLNGLTILRLSLVRPITSHTLLSCK